MAPISDDIDPPIPLVDFQAEYEKHGAATTDAMNQVVKSGQFILGPTVSKLEEVLSKFLQPDEKKKPLHCIGVSDGTAAIQLCLMALGLRQGDEVITTPFTWISSAEVIPLVGATPVFADIDEDTYLIDINSVSQLITPRTRAVITVSLYGVICDFQAIRSVLDCAEKDFGSSIALIEDAAQSFGAIRDHESSCASRHVTMSTTSFFPTKPLACYGDGGAVFTYNEKLAQSVRSLRVHGKHDGRHHDIGLNSRLDSIQAAILLSKFDLFPDSLIARRNAAARYFELMAHDDRIILPKYSHLFQTDRSAVTAWAVYTIRISQRDSVAKILRDRGVSCAVYYPVPCHMQPAFEAVLPEKPCLPVAERMSRTVLSLPMHPYLTENVQLRIVTELREALDKLQVTARPQ